MTTLTIAILFGGCSEEHDVSVKSARQIAASINLDKYKPIYLGIDKAGAWSLCDTPTPGWHDAAGPRAVISPDRETHGILVMSDSACEVLRVDAVFPVLHGKSGEDGAIQGLLELSGIPYVGCGIQSSAICMDKSLAYTVAGAAGIPTPTFHVLSTGGPVPTRLTFPVFVKPARSGSSFGVTRVERDADLGAAIESARRYDSKVLIEQAVIGTEVGCAVLGNGADLIIGELDQIDVSHGLFRIHQEAEPEKGPKNAVIEVPANIPADVRERVHETARAVYTAIGCKGLARVDMFLQPDGRVVLNEVNTMPGFTSYSRYPQMMAAAGLAMSEVIDRCITLAMRG